MYQPIEQAILPSGSRTSDPTPTPNEWVNPLAVGCDVVIDITSAGTGSITAYVEGYVEAKASAPAHWYTILASAALASNATTLLTVHPGVSDTANLKAGRPLPRRWRVRIVHGNANAITYSVDVVLYPPN